MTYEQALQIAIEQLDDAVDYLKAMNKGFPKVEKQVDELMSASNALRKALEKKREWVGLTDEDKAELLQNNVGSMLHSNAERDFALIEAKLKEKNT